MLEPGHGFSRANAVARIRREPILSGSLRQRDRWHLSHLLSLLAGREKWRGLFGIYFWTRCQKQHNRPPTTWEMFTALETQWRSQGEAWSFLISGVNYPFYSTKVKGFEWSKAHFPFTYPILTSPSGSTRDWCSTFSSFHCCSTFSLLKKSKGTYEAVSALNKRGKCFHTFTPPYHRGSGVKRCPAWRCYGKGLLHQLGQIGQECPMSLPPLSYYSLKKSVFQVTLNRA